MFEVKGFYKEKGFKKPFKRIINAGTEKRAREILFSLVGSEHGAKRKNITIESVLKTGGEKNG